MACLGGVGPLHSHDISQLGSGDFVENKFFEMSGMLIPGVQLLNGGRLMRICTEM